MRKRSKETLRQYSERYWEMFNEVQGCDQEVAAASFQNGLEPGTPLFEELMARPPADMNDLMKVVERFCLVCSCSRICQRSSSKSLSNSASDQTRIPTLLTPHPKLKACIFERLCFAHPTSIVFGRSVQDSLWQFGETLVTEAPIDCDVVISVPELKAKMKLSAVRSVVEGKRVVVVDDSIVKGTTSSKIVSLLREAGAKEVHLRIASPLIIGPCHYGVDIPASEKLISNKRTIEEIRELLGVDSLAFLPLDSLKKLLGRDSGNFCYACFSGEYPLSGHRK